MLEAFRIVEPSGRTYRIFVDGRIDGFEPHATICNRIPALLREYAYSKLKTSPLPTNEINPSGAGASHASAPSSFNCAEKIATAPGEK